MFNSKKIGLCVLAVIFCSGLCMMIFTDINAQTSHRTRVSTPGYYYIKPADVDHDAQTSLIALTETNVDRYIAGLQFVFKTKHQNANTANVTLKVNTRGAKKLLTRQGKEFNLLGLDAGVMLTATYDGANFISDYTAARSLKGKLVASLELSAGDYTANSDMLAPWTLPSGVTDVSVIDFPGGSFYGNMVTDGAIQFPDAQVTESHMGWLLELHNGTDAVFSTFKLFGYASAGFTLEPVTSDQDNVNFVMRWAAAETFTGIDTPILSIHTYDADFTLATPYTFNLYITEN